MKNKYGEHINPYETKIRNYAEKPSLPVDNIVSRKDLCKMQIEMCAHFIANDYPTINTFKNSSGEKIALKLARRMSKLVALAENG